MAAQLRKIQTGNPMRTGKNNTGSEIAKYYILKQSTNADEVAVASAVTDSLVGVSVENIANGNSASYQAGGKGVAYAGAAVAVGALLTTDSSGRAVTATQSASSTQNLIGRAVTAASGANQLIEIELFKVATAFVGSSTVATKTALKAIAVADRYNGQLVHVQADDSLWVYNSTSTAVEDTADELVQTPDGAPATGRWLRADKCFVMKIPFSYANSDGDALETIPAGFILRIAGMPFWEIEADMTGGSSSAIGISTNITGYETGGDILGGATGDVAATLVAGVAAGTIGGELNDTTGLHDLLFVAASEFQFDAITSAFTAGNGFVCVPVVQVHTA